MEAFEKNASSLTADGPDRVMPGVAMIAADRNGDILYSKSFGFTDAGPFSVDTPLWLASFTKFITSVAVLQCVEKGLIDLDENVERILPELSDLGILYGFDEKTGEPLIKKAEKKITLRHLLTHTSGLAYDKWHPLLAKWREVTKTTPVTGLQPVEKLTYPLLFEPGEGWVYGASLDWAGKAVERVNGGMKLEEYFKANIFEPLGMKHTTLRPSQNKYILDNKPESTTRAPTGGLIPTPVPVVEFMQPLKPFDDYGGHGLWSTPTEYITFLISILKNDGKLLAPETVSKMLEPQLSDNSHLIQFMQMSGTELSMTNGVPGNVTWNHSLAGVLAMEDIPNRRLKGALNWHGIDNSFWWVDRERGTCGLTATQLSGLTDVKAASLFSDFEAMIFELSGTKSS
ncbi:beta-lactamase [Histoplasma capsulatum G186AR]|uniref:Beta-lactamase n=1 Tax=Ajellomyces capsulatus TaxID=5037 RepID=A0A8H8D2U7_AJECA|nr:beta-lactamase [Histoplasma capsulatum]QSS67672.1 beta-lactamase [Histoplasma capsulatum G186AR]